MDVSDPPGGRSPDGRPAQIGRYRVVSALGRGVFGTVYLGQDDQVHRMVAIKVPHRELTENPDHLAACLAEARRFAAIEHPHVVPVFEVGSTPEHPCFTVSRFIEGASLQQRLAESRLSHGEAARLVGLVAGALHAAHLRRVVHGNIKPSNLLLDRRGDVFVTDFSPQIVRGRRLAGTPEYMSPEQIRGEEHRIEPRSDIFSLGVVFYELLTRRRPFGGDSIETLAEQIVAGAPTPPRQIDASIPTELERVCLKMLQSRLDDRYESAQELADELLGLPVEADGVVAAVGERGLRVGRGTFVFTDFKGFTERIHMLEQAAGPRAAAEMKRTVASYVERALALVDGSSPPTAYRLIDTAGDGFFLHFQGAEAAYRFAAALQEATAGHNRRVTDTLAEHWFRTGAATGEVAWDGDKPVGNVVNVCSRHQAACAGGDFVVDEATYVDLAPDIRSAFGPPESMSDKNGAVHVVRRTGFGRPLAPLAAAVTRPSAAEPPPVVPKGLRSFDASDSEFFLQLVPGPRNLQGLPDSIRLIKTRVEARDHGETFAVGCVYGPSGCGKSSLIKAGVLPRLSPGVIAVFVEASSDDTEHALVGRLRARFPSLPPHCSLTEAVTTLRRGELIPEGGKLLIVVDQFEQWLQSHARDHGGDLASALRQCDGTHVQCFVTVRDDYWVTVNRFMFDIDVRLVERANSFMIDLFDVDHAAKVLASFGRAFGRLPHDPGAVSREQEQFLREAIAGLAVDDKVVPVRLALFAEIMKAKPWQPAVLRKLGGAAGVGVAFLEETFGATSVSARHRHHQKAAQAVLECLLPEEGTTIRRRRSRHELLEASGYGRHPADFSGLIDLLDSELRLVVAISEHDDVAAAGGGDDGVSYQLAHDYLVPSLREWLTRGQKETRRGRAELLLADRATVWHGRREHRQLPSLWQCLQIRWWTRRRNWTQPQQAMMREAGRYYLSRSAITIMAVLAVATIAREFFGNLRATVLRERLLVARIRDVPAIVKQIEPYRSRVQPLLEAASREQETRDDPVRDLAIHLALLPGDGTQIEQVFEHLLQARPQDVGVIVAALEPFKEVVSERLWNVLGDARPQTRDGRIRAACALAAYEPDSARWGDAAGPVAALLVNEEPLVLGTWSEALRPVSARLVPPLTELFIESSSSALKVRAASVLGDYLSDRPADLAELLLDDFLTGYTLPFAKVEARAAEVIPILLAEIDRALPESPDESVRERDAKRKANAAVGLVKLGRPERVWGLLRQSSDPRIRSYVIDRLAISGAGSVEVADRFEQERDVTVRRALLLILGSYAEENVPSDVRQRMLSRSRELYRHDPDPGIHGASKWLLRMWSDDEWLRETDAALRTEASDRAATQPATAIPSDTKTPSWHVNAAGQTMVTIPGPVEFAMGSPKDDDAATFNDPVHPKRIRRTYAIADTPVTIGQFRDFKPDYALASSLGREPDLPVVRIDWYAAAAYCNFLSEQDGIPAAQWCYEDVSADGRIDIRPKRNLLALAGYRMPTEAEIEFATRAGSTTDRPYGESEELLSRYAWSAGNSDGMTHPVGRLKPNDFGLFDTLGNVLEWSQNIYLPDPQERLRATTRLDDDVDATELFPGDAFRTVFRSQRGGSFMHSRWETRSATRINYAVLTDSTDYMGFRVARTVRIVPPHADPTTDPSLPRP